MRKTEERSKPQANEENIVHFTFGQAICNLTPNCCFLLGQDFQKKTLSAAIQCYGPDTTLKKPGRIVLNKTVCNRAFRLVRTYGEAVI